MKTCNNMTEAISAAELFFSENFGYNSGVGIESENGNEIEFYSKDDPGMDDTFTCIVNPKFIYFYDGQPIQRINFLNNVPQDWKDNFDEYGSYSYGYYRAEISD